MKIVTGIASTTHIDVYLERMTKEALNGMAQQINSKYIRQTVEHQPGLQIGIVLCGKIKQLSDGEFGLFAVFGIFDNESEYRKYPLGTPNIVWEKYVSLLNDVSTEIKELHQEDASTKDEIPSIATLLERHLDSTAIWEDGSVYKVKHLIARSKDLEFHVYPKDHYPPHFHVTSKQRGIEARFHIDTLELVSIKNGNVRNSDAKKVRNFFETYPDKWKALKEAYARMQQE